MVTTMTDDLCDNTAPHPPHIRYGDRLRRTNCPGRHRAVLVVELTIERPEQIAEALTAINPPSIPAFAGAVRVAIGDVATALVEWLDEDTDQERVAVKPDPTHGQIDRDIQDQVDEMRPRNIGQRVTIERTLQDRRDKGDGR